MTPKQAERLQTKIKQIKSALAADKKRSGGYYDDSAGRRYQPPQYYIQLGDYSGGATYFRWFHKNFPDDAGFPDFLFEWTLTLFKTGKIKDAEKKAFKTFCRNTYIFDKFLGKPIVPIVKWEGSNLEVPGFTDYFHYTHQQPELADFTCWLQGFMATEKFVAASHRFIEIQQQLKTEDNYEERVRLREEEEQLEEGF